jgi:hypothetical protein
LILQFPFSDFDPRELELQKAKQQQGYLSSAHASLKSSDVTLLATAMVAILFQMSLRH